MALNPYYTDYPHPNIYDIRTLLEPFDQGPLVHTFLRDTFFQTRSYPPTNLVEFDFRRGRRQMAPFVAPLIGGKAMERKGWETRFFQAPRVAPVRNLRAIEAEQRLMGESATSGRTAADRAAEILAEDAVFCDEAIGRREEWMCRELLVNGHITVTADEGYQMLINYMESAAGPVSNRFTVPIAWDQPTADPMMDLDNARVRTIRESGVMPNVALFGRDAYTHFMRNVNVYNLLNNRRFEMGTLERAIVSDVVQIFGAVIGLQLYTYDEVFEDDYGNLFPMLPQDLVILISTNVQNRIVYGAYTQLEDDLTGRFVTYQQARIPFVYGDREHNHMFYRLTSLPLPMPFDVLGFRVIETGVPITPFMSLSAGLGGGGAPIGPQFAPQVAEGAIPRTEYGWSPPKVEQESAEGLLTEHEKEWLKAAENPPQPKPASGEKKK